MQEDQNRKSKKIPLAFILGAGHKDHALDSVMIDSSAPRRFWSCRYELALKIESDTPARTTRYDLPGDGLFMRYCAAFGNAMKVRLVSLQSIFGAKLQVWSEIVCFPDV